VTVPAAPASDSSRLPASARPRIESLSDLVFGLALSLGAIALLANPPSDAGSLYADLLSFGFSFLILISVWLAYTRLVAGLLLESPRAVAWNIVLLFSVSIEPFLFNILQRPNLPVGFFAAVSQAYAIDLAVMMSVLGILAWTRAGVEKAGAPPAHPGNFRTEAAHRWLVAAIFLVSAAPVFAPVRVGTLSLRVVIWIVALAILLVERLTRSRAVAIPARVPG
jgi:uncharacterized membrane protein